ncbi:MAG: glycoside hydrolase family 11 protein [Oscillospiraceae bacterium]|nr:glycoside hydrolase family 11 protein [Oscillospiraceae bacterium]
MKKLPASLLTALIIITAAVSASAQVIVDEPTQGYRTHEPSTLDYELWHSTAGVEKALMVIEDDGTFLSEWNTTGGRNIIFRTGRRFGRLRNYSEWGDISINYDVQYVADGDSAIGVYGWYRNPTIEYYIIEAWQGERPVGDTHIGEFTVDGDTYDISISAQYNTETPFGTLSFYQVWSTRRTARTAGTVSVSEHYKTFDELLATMGIEVDIERSRSAIGESILNETSLYVQGQNSVGSAQVDLFELTYDGQTVGGGQTSAIPTAPVTPTETVETPATTETTDTPATPTTESTSDSPPAPAPAPAPAAADTTATDANSGSNPLVIILAVFVMVGVLIAIVGSVNTAKANK